HPFRHQHHWPETAHPAVLVQAPALPQGLAEWCRLIDTHARAVLGDQPRAPLDFDTPLVEQGFTSLLALELRRVLEAAFGRTLPPTLLYNYPSIHRMAALFAGTDAPSPADRHPAVPSRP